MLPGVSAGDRFDKRAKLQKEAMQVFINVEVATTAAAHPTAATAAHPTARHCPSRLHNYLAVLVSGIAAVALLL